MQKLIGIKEEIVLTTDESNYRKTLQYVNFKYFFESMPKNQEPIHIKQNDELQRQSVPSENVTNQENIQRKCQQSSSRKNSQVAIDTTLDKQIQLSKMDANIDVKEEAHQMKGHDDQGKIQKIEKCIKVPQVKSTSLSQNPSQIWRERCLKAISCFRKRTFS